MGGVPYSDTSFMFVLRSSDAPVNSYFLGSKPLSFSLSGAEQVHERVR